MTESLSQSQFSLVQIMQTHSPEHDHGNRAVRVESVWSQVAFVPIASVPWANNVFWIAAFSHYLDRK